MADQLDNKHFDKRVMQRYVRRGVVDEKELERHLKSLVDLSEQALPVEASIEGEDGGGEGAARG